MSIRSRSISTLLVCLGFVSGAVHSQTFTALDLSGGELFNRYCAACHGESMRGDGPVAAGLITQVPDLTRIAARAGGIFPRAAARELVDGRSPVIAHGTREMPVWGREFWFEEGADITAETRVHEMIERLLDFLESRQETD